MNHQPSTNPSTYLDIPFSESLGIYIALWLLRWTSKNKNKLYTVDAFFRFDIITNKESTFFPPLKNAYSSFSFILSVQFFYLCTFFFFLFSFFFFFFFLFFFFFFIPLDLYSCHEFQSRNDKGNKEIQIQILMIIFFYFFFFLIHMVSLLMNGMERGKEL